MVVTELQGAFQVAVVDATNTAHIRTVRVGQQIGSDWLIESGLEPDERVVAEGTQKARDGTKVEPEPYQTPPTDKQAGITTTNTAAKKE